MKTFTDFLSEDEVRDAARSLGMSLSRKLKGWDTSKNPHAVAIIDSEEGRVEEAKKAIDTVIGATGKWKHTSLGDITTFDNVTVAVVDTGSAVKVMVTK